MPRVTFELKFEIIRLRKEGFRNFQLLKKRDNFTISRQHRSRFIRR